MKRLFLFVLVAMSFAAAVSAEELPAEETLTVPQGDPRGIVLTGGEGRILFGNGGREDSVPDLVFGDRYEPFPFDENDEWSDIGKNVVPIRREVVFYEGGYLVRLENKGCRTEERETDVVEVWVLDCQVAVSRKKSPPPSIAPKSFSKEVSAGFRGMLGEEPLIYAVVPKISLMEYHREGEKAPSYTKGLLTIALVTGYGNDVVRFTPAELVKKETKDVVIGPLRIRVAVQSAPSAQVYYEPGKLRTLKYENFTFMVTAAPESATPSPVRLVSFSQ